jgi:hypothetical protein
LADDGPGGEAAVRASRPGNSVKGGPGLGSAASGGPSASIRGDSANTGGSAPNTIPRRGRELAAGAAEALPEANSLVAKASGGRALAEASYPVGEGAVVSALIVRAVSPSSGRPEGTAASAYLLNDGSLATGRIYGPDGEDLARKLGGIMTEHCLAAMNGIAVPRGAGAAAPAPYPARGNSRRRVTVAFDPLCPVAAELMESDAVDALLRAGAEILWAPVNAIPGSLGHGEYFLREGRLPATGEAEADVRFWGRADGAALAGGPAIPEGEWFGPSRVLENTWRFRSIIGREAEPASPVAFWREGGVLKSRLGVPLPGEIDAARIDREPARGLGGVGSADRAARETGSAPSTGPSRPLPTISAELTGLSSAPPDRSATPGPAATHGPRTTPGQDVTPVPETTPVPDATPEAAQVTGEAAQVTGEAAQVTEGLVGKSGDLAEGEKEEERPYGLYCGLSDLDGIGRPEPALVGQVTQPEKPPVILYAAVNFVTARLYQAIKSLKAAAPVPVKSDLAADQPKRAGNGFFEWKKAIADGSDDRNVPEAGKGSEAVAGYTAKMGSESDTGPNALSGGLSALKAWALGLAGPDELSEALIKPSGKAGAASELAEAADSSKRFAEAGSVAPGKADGEASLNPESKASGSQDLVPTETVSAASSGNHVGAASSGIFGKPVKTSSGTEPAMGFGGPAGTTPCASGSADVMRVQTPGPGSGKRGCPAVPQGRQKKPTTAVSSGGVLYGVNGTPLLNGPAGTVPVLALPPEPPELAGTLPAASPAASPAPSPALAYPAAPLPNVTSPKGSVPDVYVPAGSGKKPRLSVYEPDSRAAVSAKHAEIKLPDRKILSGAEGFRNLPDSLGGKGPMKDSSLLGPNILPQPDSGR